jgi:hypothetical protein
MGDGLNDCICTKYQCKILSSTTVAHLLVTSHKVNITMSHHTVTTPQVDDDDGEVYVLALDAVKVKARTLTSVHGRAC